MSQQYDFAISDVIRESWEKVFGSKVVIWGALLINVLVQVAIGVLLSLIIGQHPANGVISQIIALPLSVGLLMIAVYRAANLPATVPMVWAYYPKIVYLVAVTVLSSMFVGIPAFLGVTLITVGLSSSMIFAVLGSLVGIALIAVGVYLWVGYSFSSVLLVEKNLSIWQSLEISRKAVNQHWFKVFFTSLLGSLLIILPMLPLMVILGLHLGTFLIVVGLAFFLVALIWMVPFWILIRGILYRILFGVRAIEPSASAQA